MKTITLIALLIISSFASADCLKKGVLMKEASSYIIIDKSYWKQTGSDWKQSDVNDFKTTLVCVDNAWVDASTSDTKCARNGKFHSDGSTFKAIDRSYWKLAKSAFVKAKAKDYLLTNECVNGSWITSS